jgi:hypothetical protein
LSACLPRLRLDRATGVWMRSRDGSACCPCARRTGRSTKINSDTSLRCGGRSPCNDRSLACYLLLLYTADALVLCSSFRLAPAAASRPLFLVPPHSTRRCTGSVAVPPVARHQSPSPSLCLLPACRVAAVLPHGSSRCCCCVWLG